MRARRGVAVLLVAAAAVLTGFTTPESSAPAPDATFQAEHERAEAALKAGEVDEAVKYFKKANKRKGGASVDCHWGLARSYYQQGDDKRTIESCEWLAANASPTLKAQALNLKGVVLTRGDDLKPERLQEAEQVFRAALGLEPRNDFFIFNLGTVLLKQGKTEEGQQQLEQYLKSSPSGASAGRPAG